MSNVEAWDAEHKRREWGTWPDSHLVRYMMRSWPDKAKRGDVKVLDVGCGAGAQSFFMAKEGFVVAGLDASTAAIERCQQRAWYMDMADKNGLYFARADAGAIPADAEQFDVVTDVCSLQCLNAEEYRQAIGEIARVLKPGGRFFSIHMADDSWRGVSVVGEIYPRHSSELIGIISPHFKADYLHEQHERLVAGSAVIRVAHWLIEGRKR